MKTKYQRPSVQTVAGRQIVERMGPVSCGSGFGTPQPADDAAFSPVGSDLRKLGS